MTFPSSYLRAVIRYKAEAAGIVVVEQEESYTSKASFLDDDYIPTYGVDDERAKFSGRRRPTRYAGMHDPKGFRGLYVSKNGTIVNSDLNGAANILRKAYPDAFEIGTGPDFTKVETIRRPDGERIAANRAAQLARANTSPSKSKARRLSKKKRRASCHESNPTGIGLRE